MRRYAFRRIARWGLASLALLFHSDASACRCKAQTLAEYFDGAAEVTMARVVAADLNGSDLLLHAQLIEHPWKVAPSRAAPLRSGDYIRYRTAASSAACGVSGQVDAIYLFFAGGDASSGAPLRVGACDGSRVYRATPDSDAVGFADVPARFVVGQLNALAGLAVLRDAAKRAPAETDPENTTLIGLLDLKSLAHGGVVPVRETPDANARVVVTAGSYADVERKEVGYEVPAAAVVARVDGWYRIRLNDGGFGWVAPEDAGTWFPYEELPIRRLAYLHAHWDGLVWPDPGAGIPSRSRLERDGDRQRFSVEVTESRRIGGLVWFRVDVLTASPCDGGEVGTAISGWVPGYGRDGSPTVWFYSRGC